MPAGAETEEVVAAVEPMVMLSDLNAKATEKNPPQKLFSAGSYLLDLKAFYY